VSTRNARSRLALTIAAINQRDRQTDRQTERAFRCRLHASINDTKRCRRTMKDSCYEMRKLSAFERFEDATSDSDSIENIRCDVADLYEWNVLTAHHIVTFIS